MKKFSEGSIVPVLYNKELKWCVITETFSDNYHIIDHVGIDIYQVLDGDILKYIDDICIYNGYSFIKKTNKERNNEKRRENSLSFRWIYFDQRSL